MSRRVVVTGMGAITPIGNNVKDFFQNIKENKCGIDYIKRFDTENYRVKLAAEVKDFDPTEYMERKEARRMDRFSQLAIAAAKEAFEDSNIDIDKINRNRFGVIVGSGIGGIENIEKEANTLANKGPRRVNPLFVPMIITNMAAGNIAIRFGAKGVCTNVVTACAAGVIVLVRHFGQLNMATLILFLLAAQRLLLLPLGIAGFFLNGSIYQ